MNAGPTNAVGGSNDGDVAFLIGLASLDQVGPSRLAALLGERSPREAWENVCRGVHIAATRTEGATGITAELAAAWRNQAAGMDLDTLAGAHAEAGVAVLTPGDPCFHGLFEHDPSPPYVLFARGRLEPLGSPKVAIVGTRNCTRYGRDLAEMFGRELSEAGVTVVSGLALGIDGAAHRGALAARAVPPIGVVGSGLDVVYPRSHRQLWNEVADYGALIAEYPLGVRPAPWRFPARNRIIAALADLTLVVESRVAGGSMLTVDESVARNKDVLAVPGSVHSPASSGTNKLLFDGCGMVRDTDDILLRLGQFPAAASVIAKAKAARTEEKRPKGDAAAVLEAIGWEPASTEQIVVRTNLTVSQIATVLDQLADGGWITNSGGWYEQIGKPRAHR